MLVPHPDDEFAAWALVQYREPIYPVFVLLTHGEGTSFCDGRGLQTDLGERVPRPQPFTGPRTRNCRRQRLDSWHAFLDGMAAVDPSLDAPERVGDVDGCEVFVGERSARVVFDGGDGRLRPDFVTAALAHTRRLRHRHFPVQAEHRVVGAAYRNAGTAGSVVYDHPDHRAVHLALWHTDHGLPGSQWARTARGDEDAVPPGGRTESVEPELYDWATLVEPDGRRTGLLQVVYGWLAFDADGKWDAGETDETTIFSRSQTFWRRF